MTAASWQVGDTRITALVEATTPVPPSMLVPAAVADDLRSVDWMPPGFAADDGTSMGFCVQSFVLEQQGKVVLVDPCVGNHKSLEIPLWNDLDLPWLDDLRAAGFEPADVDIVLHTHLHEDHIGWDTHLVDGMWVPTFTNAIHVYVGDELDYTRGDDRRVGQDPWAESVAPILDAGLAQETTADADIGHGIQLLPTLGHTPGHCSIAVSTGAEDLLITGDVVFHPFQFAASHLTQGSDWKPTMARQTRRDFFDLCATSGSVVAGTHFPTQPLGQVERKDDAWRYHPIRATT